MGLDITAYRQLKPAPDAELDADGYPVDWEKHHTFSEAVLKWSNETFDSPRAADMKPGTYTSAEKFGFRAGSYSGYNAWRDWLARAAGYGSAECVWNTPITSGPFVELLNFADNEGTIGPSVSAKLARDFAEHEARIEALPQRDRDWDMALYRQWRKAFEMAADGGCVDFH